MEEANANANPQLTTYSLQGSRGLHLPSPSYIKALPELKWIILPPMRGCFIGWVQAAVVTARWLQCSHSDLLSINDFVLPPSGQNVE